MLIYVDTEFTDLSLDAQLISLGAITETGQTFYRELSPLPPGCSEFVRLHVLPHLEAGEAACPRAVFPDRLAAWLRQWPDPVLVSDSSWDIFMVRKTLSGKGNHHPGRLRVGDADGEGVVVQLTVIPPLGADAEAAFQEGVFRQMQHDPRPHHALADAAALRAGVANARHLLGSLGLIQHIQGQLETK